jgi:ribonuclease E
MAARRPTSGRAAAGARRRGGERVAEDGDEEQDADEDPEVARRVDAEAGPGDAGEGQRAEGGDGW